MGKEPPKSHGTNSWMGKKLPKAHTGQTGTKTGLSKAEIYQSQNVSFPTPSLSTVGDSEVS